MPNLGLRGGTGPGLVLTVARRYWTAGGPNWAAAVGLRLLLALLPIAVLAFAALLVVAGILLSVLLFPLGSAVQRTGVLGRSAVHARLTLQPVAGVLPGVVLAAAGNAVLNLIWPVYLRYAASTLTVSYLVFGFVVAIATHVSLLAQLVVIAISLNATLHARRAARVEAVAATG